MASPTPRRGRQVRVTVFDNEPMARLAEQRLRQMGIPCVVRSLRGGPGLWGSAYNLPHDLVVSESDAEQAREVLGLEPEGLPLNATDTTSGESERPSPSLVSTLAGVAVVVVLLVLVVGLLGRMG